MLDKMIPGARNALDVVLGLQKDETVLVITDQPKEVIGQAFHQAAGGLGARTEIFSLPQDQRPLSEIPAELLPMLAGNDVVLNVFEGMAEETPFRIKLVKKEIGENSRVGHCPGITDQMMTQGPMTADYKAIAMDVDALIAKFENASSVHITAPAGTNLVMNIKDRGFDTDVRIGAGKMGNLPAGEIWCAPVEDGANGVMVVDGSIGNIGNVPSPLKVFVENGKIARMETEDKDFLARITELCAVDEWASVVGELGIGLNPRARLVGIMLEDEKAGETAHIAFGNNQEMPGGQNSSKTHRDFLFYKPTIVVSYTDGSTRTLLKDGKMV